jgi:phosphatidylinositol kinase/protein kinase (PI-3  family)
MSQAGLGLTGVEGAYRNGCENAMAVLRDSSDTLTALMRAIVHDPLVDWGSEREGAAAKKVLQHSFECIIECGCTDPWQLSVA